jgi:hypothetical protein
LRLWIDANHDGISQPQELHTLAEMGVTAISLSYQRIERRDENGNIFLFRTNVQPGRDTQVSHTAYDVFFVTPKIVTKKLKPLKHGGTEAAEEARRETSLAADCADER